MIMYHISPIAEFRLQRETENDVPDGLDGAIALADCIKTLMKVS